MAYSIYAKLLMFVSARRFFFFFFLGGGGGEGGVRTCSYSPFMCITSLDYLHVIAAAS